jgi:hypothetical protein
MSEIGAEVGRVAALAGIAFVVAIMAGLLAVLGTSLFLGEWLLGSMGWGVLHGILLFVAVAVACGFVAVGQPGGRVAGAFLAGVLVAVVVGVFLALNVPNSAYAQVGEALIPDVEEGIRPLVTGTAIWALLGLLLGIILAFRGGGVAAIVGGAIVGALIGAFTAITFGVQPGVGIGIAAGYVTWIAVMGMMLARDGVDAEALKARFTPTRTIETSKETLEWLQSRMPPGIGS